MKVATILLAACSFLLLLPMAWADQVILKNGDRISGNLVKMVDGELEIDTPYAGVIKLKWDHVAQVITAAPAEVKLNTGEVVKGELTESGSGTFSVQSEVLGESQSIPLEEVTSINAPTLPVKWTGFVQAGSTYRTGNTETLNGSLRASLVRETKQDRISSDVAWDYQESEGDLTARSASAQVKYDYFAWLKNYLYAVTSLETDEFKDLNLRTKLGAGVGRRFITSPTQLLEGELGLTYINDDFETATDEDTVALRLFGRYKRGLLENLDFMQVLEALPSVEDGSDVQLTSTTEFSTRLSARWSAVWTLIDQYDNKPALGFERNDFTNMFSLRCTF
jgi:putative salt-induced outer membrane protein YdiY